MNTNRALKLIATVYLAVLVLAFLIYLYDSFSFMHLLQRLQLQDTPSMRKAFLGNTTVSPLVKYFVLAIMCVFAFVGCMRLPQLKLFAILNLILAFWLTISALQEYYSILDFKITMAIGIILIGLAFIVYLLILFRKSLNAG